MSTPRRHHFVPQFHQKRFVGTDGRLWVWDKAADRIFQTTPGSIAVETDFYRLHEFEKLGYDAFIMEKQLSEMEGQMHCITEQWLSWLRNIDAGARIKIPSVNRKVVSRYIAVQFLRTADTREILRAFHDRNNPEEPLSKDALRSLHTELMWNLPTVDMIAEHIRDAIWVFARNLTSTPLLTSDNPVAFRTRDNTMWVKGGFLKKGAYAGAYAVYPLAPDIVMFCYEKERKLKKFDGCLSPVLLNNEMVESENSGQVFMASRFVISSMGDFAAAREFSKTIGTDIYKRFEGARSPDRRHRF